MARQTLSSTLIASIAGIELARDLGNATGLAFSSDRVKAGDVFFALAGEHSHGIKYAEQALENGAAFIVSDKYHKHGMLVDEPAKLLMDLGHWARAQHSGNIIAVTGSAGKTSTKNFIAQALDIPKSPGNFNTPLALAKTLVENLLNQSHAKDLVLELGIDHQGEMDILVDLAKPDYAVLTLISASHLAGLESIAIVASEKKKILTNTKLALVSEDALAYVQKNNKIKTYGLYPKDLDYSSKILKQDINGQNLEFRGLEFHLPVLSSAMAKAATAAMAIATELGYDLAQAAKRLQSVRLEPRRLEIKRHKDFIILDDSYNSSPAALIEAIKVLKTLPKAHTAILGDMLELGANSAQLHKDLAKYLTDIDLITIGNYSKHFGDLNPNSEHFSNIEQAQAYLTKFDKSGSILVKASLGMKFIDVIDILEAEK